MLTSASANATFANPPDGERGSGAPWGQTSQPQVGRLFTPGPVPMSPRLLELASRQLPYNRTSTFSEFTHELIGGLKQLFDTQGDVVLLTASGTGAMEASIQNLLDDRDRALVVNGGVFGQRWVDLCRVHGVPFDEWKVETGRALDVDALRVRLARGSYSTLLITAHETSTGVLHDLRKIGEVTAERNVLLVADAISTVGADDFHMDEWHVDVAILSSQKALALPPGLSFVALSQRARQKLTTIQPRTIYFRLRDYLQNQERGQSPYTPAIGLFVLLHARLQDIAQLTVGGLVDQHARRAAYFRARIADLPLSLLPDRPSNAITALRVSDSRDARDVVQALAARHEIFVTPNGGELNSSVFRVGHLGEQSHADLDGLRSALDDIFSSP